MEKQAVKIRIFSGYRSENETYNKIVCKPCSLSCLALTKVIFRKEVGLMWVKPDFEVIEVCAEVTAYAYQK
ncbi:pyrroloquinoline quinone precursor peptide PqqA [Paenibacillus piri]|uniref:Coenzyme PQQ synthesis protein A n=1 Tax=Paenibacillus piri TaxID=2547395 RepID=A0A4R5KUM8_9BACL|nr:pyrroloquinoline quinone precursor peptide PqqA [Paenibacillus piri]